LNRDGIGMFFHIAGDVQPNLSPLASTCRFWLNMRHFVDGSDIAIFIEGDDCSAVQMDLQGDFD